MGTLGLDLCVKSQAKEIPGLDVLGRVASGYPRVGCARKGC